MAMCAIAVEAEIKVEHCTSIVPFMLLSFMLNTMAWPFI